MEKELLFTGCGNVGIGLWTLISIAWSNLVGKESKAFKKKQNIALALANNRLIDQLEYTEAKDYADYRVEWSSRLSVSVSIRAKVNVEEENKEGAYQDGKESFDERNYKKAKGSLLKAGNYKDSQDLIDKSTSLINWHSK